MAAVADVVDMEEEKEGEGEGRVEGTGEMSILTGGGFFVGLFFPLAVELVDAGPAPVLIGEATLSLPGAGEAKQDGGGEEVETGDAAILVMAASGSM